MAMSIAKQEETRLARPLKVLSPLIKQEIEAGEAAGLEHYQAAGEMLVEARSQLKHGEWTAWYDKQKFNWSQRQAQRYMALVEVTAKTSPRRFWSGSLEAAIGETRTPRIPEPAYHSDVQETVSTVNSERLAQEYKNRREEDQLVLELCRKIVKIGFQVLSKELHPDHGGSDEAQARLNKANTRLKEMLSR